MLGAVGQGSKGEAKVICGGLSPETLDNAIKSRGVEMGWCSSRAPSSPNGALLFDKMTPERVLQAVMYNFLLK
jgi:hypothetical protein